MQLHQLAKEVKLKVFVKKDVKILTKRDFPTPAPHVTNKCKDFQKLNSFVSICFWPNDTLY